jgi:hypothetical protein
MKVFYRPPATPEGQQFYTRYASLVPALTKSGYLAQIVSGLTEWGILYALIYSSLAAFWPDHAAAAGIAGATVGVLVVEVGLRRLLPYGARAIIYKRWQGLDLWISCVVLATAALLLAVSALLSFTGSRSLVDNMASPPAEATTTATDSLATAEADLVTASWQRDESDLVKAYDVRLDAVRKAAAATVRRLDGQLATIRTKERTSGQNYTTRRAQLAELKTDAEADRDEQLASLTTEREAQLAEIRSRNRGQLDGITVGRNNSRNQVANDNAAALQDHQQQVNSYGGGLAWFTVVCLVILIVSVVIKELHQAGAGIVEQVEPDAYTFEAGAVAAFVGALQGRFTRFAFGLVHHIERGTPEAPEPVAAPILWQHKDQLKVAQAADGVARRVKKLKPLKVRKGDDVAPAAAAPAERNQIGFSKNSSGKAKTPLTQLTQLHTTNAHIEPTQETTSEPSQAFVQSRLKMYRQRLGNAQQRATVQQRKRGEVNPKTAAAIQNNQQHVAHYSELLKSLTDEQ